MDLTARRSDAFATRSPTGGSVPRSTINTSIGPVDGVIVTIPQARPACTFCLRCRNFQGDKVFEGATVGTASGDSGGLRDGVGEDDRFAVDDGLAVPVGDGRREAVALVADVLDHLALGGDAVADVDGAEVADLL